MAYPIPLFDRLIDEEPKVLTETPPLSTYNTEEFFQSVARDVSRLLNTRSVYGNLHHTTPDIIRWSVVGYGYIDFSAVGENQENWHLLAVIMAQTIMRFEPRFLNVHVEIEHYEPLKQHLTLDVAGDVKMGTLQQRIQFSVQAYAPEIKSHE